MQDHKKAMSKRIPCGNDRKKQKWIPFVNDRKNGTPLPSKKANRSDPQRGKTDNAALRWRKCAAAFTIGNVRTRHKICMAALCVAPDHEVEGHT